LVVVLLPQPRSKKVIKIIYFMIILYGKL